MVSSSRASGRTERLRSCRTRARSPRQARVPASRSARCRDARPLAGRCCRTCRRSCRRPWRARRCVSARRCETAVMPTPSAAADASGLLGRNDMIDARIAEHVLELKAAEERRQRHDGLAGDPGGELRQPPSRSRWRQEDQSPGQLAGTPPPGRRPARRARRAVIAPLSSDIAARRRRSATSSRKTSQELNHAPQPSPVCRGKPDDVAVDGINARRELVIASPGVGIGDPRAVGVGERQRAAGRAARAEP